MEQIILFKDKEAFYAWLDQNHLTSVELWVIFYKKDARKESMTWSESVDVALCFGWIDGIRKTIDSISYKIRFTPRRENSSWSEVNIRKVLKLISSKKMRPEGLHVFNQRKEKIGYSSKSREVPLDIEYLNLFTSNEKAWLFFSRQSSSYKRDAVWWVMNAKKVETRLKRLNILIDKSMQDKKVVI